MERILSKYQVEKPKKTKTREISDRHIAPCLVNGLEAFEGEINLGNEDNMISIEFAVKLCLDYEERFGKKIIKKELIMALRGEIYFLKFIINPKQDDVEPCVIFGRSFMHLTKGIVDFGNVTITIYPELDLFLEDSDESRKSVDDWDFELDKIYFGDIPKMEGADIPCYVCKMGKSDKNKRKPVIETMAYSDKYKKILDEICLDKMKLDGENSIEEEKAFNKIKGKALIEKDDPRAFIIPIRLEGKINLNALVDTGSDINVLPYRIYQELRRDDIEKVNKVTMIIAKFLILDMPIDRDAPALVRRGFLHTCGSILNTIERITSTYDGFCHQTFRAAKTSINTTESDSDDEEEFGIKRNKFGAPIYGPQPAKYLNCHDPLDRFIALQETKGTHDHEARSSRSKRSRQHESVEESMLPHVNQQYLLWEGCTQAAKSHYNTRLEEIKKMLTIRLTVEGMNEEIFTSDA
ncbi:DNA-directed DNA polymerase [Tanacetum coccineum]